MSDWWVGMRVAQPERIDLISGDNRRIAMSLANHLASGESTSTTNMTADIYNWRTRDLVTPDAITDPLTYDSGTKTVTLKVNAATLPVREALALVIRFDVSGPGGSDRRSVHSILWLEI